MQTATLQSLNSIFAAPEYVLLLPWFWVDILQKEMFLQVNRLSFNGGAREMLEEKEYCAIDMVFRIACGFIDHLTVYTKSPNMTTVHEIYIL